MRYLLVFLLAVNVLYSATLFGQVYESNTFSKLNNTRIKLDGPISIQLIVQGDYSVDIPLGTYNLTASYYKSGKVQYYTEEKIKITQEQTRFDVVLFPAELQNMIPKDESREEEKNGIKIDNSMILFGFIVLFIIIIYLLYKSLSKPAKTQIMASEEDEEQEFDEEAFKVLEILNSHEGRILQKELRNIMNLSESNMSILITELESMGYVKRIKKGRENVLKLIKPLPKK